MIVDCDGCEERRKLLAEWMDAWRQWALNPTGPSAQTILAETRAKVNRDSTNPDSTR